MKGSSLNPLTPICFYCGSPFSIRSVLDWDFLIMFWTLEMVPLVWKLSFEQLLPLTFEPKMQLTAFETELGC